MSNTPPSRPLPPRPGDNESILVSPLNPLLPTGYRNIQPFQKGKGWHSNGRTPRHRVASTQADDTDIIDPKERGVVFPLLPCHEHVRSPQGPDASAVEMATSDDRQENEAAIKPTVISPTPPNAAPRRPSRTDIRTNSGSFRSRALSGSPRSSSRPTSPATDETLKLQREEKEVPGPDPVLMQQLWQEYAARSHAANRQVNAAAYHEKMHRRYGEQRALKERIAQLEQALEMKERERNEAQQQAEHATKTLELLGTSDSAALSMKTSVIKPQAGEPENAEEKSYRERSFALERALSQTKTSLLALQEQLRQQTTQATERTQTLEAQLVLERNTNLELARQLRETSASFTRVSEELVETRVSLEREQQRSQEIMDRARLQNVQLLSDTRRGQLENRMKLAVRSLGREALKQKMETLMRRTMRAEQNMRVAQLETERVSRERAAICEQLEQVLSSHAIKYHSLGASGGIPGILKRSTPLTNGSRMVSDQLLLLQVLYEETEQPEDPDDGFRIHFVAYEPRSAQDDFLTFYLRDIQRIIPNHESYLARHSVRRRERLGALAELLLSHAHAGYKNGHLVLAETSGPEAATRFPGEQLTALQEQQQTQQVTVYRGTRYLSVIGNENNDAVLAELSVTEAFAAATSQVWWLEVRAVLLGCEGCDSLPTKVDLRQLLTFCSTFASYRPSQRHDGNNDDPELFAVHEELLEPLFHNLRVVCEAGGAAKLELIGVDEEKPSVEPQNQRRLSVENQIIEQEEETAMTLPTSTPSTLTHQSAVNVGNVFYCVRLQELWDGELLLDVTMDDPETQHHFHRVLYEPQLAKLVERLVRDGVLDDEEDEEAALQVKYGLASILHRPLCKLVVSNVRPVLPHPSQTSNKAATAAGEIDVSSLFGDESSGESLTTEGGTGSYEIRTMVIEASICASLGWSSSREVRVITASKNALADEKAVHQALQDILTVEATQVHRQRTGVRFRGEKAGFSLVSTISANLSYCGNVTISEVLPLTEHDGPSLLPLVLVVEDPTKEELPLQLVFKTIGIEEDSSEFTRRELASSRTGSRAENSRDHDTLP
ncbi:hypothetical protein PI124_g7336 [Phytophthora idaei]|nr:hypothetical protein PI125_g5122 [Phytophthora idaei]KAG3162011.1 hypothetical protein PI126_g6163 [Phytophthora idaei]KAG3247977.1 hypothetical protein PI124_g7336 [Phytophthora idaei]